MTDKKKAMTPKWFLALATRSTKTSAEGFLAAHREFLETGVLAKDVTPILAKIDAKEVLPTPGLEAIKSVAFSHMLAFDAAAAEAALEKSQNAPEPQSDKPYQACIKDSNGLVATRTDEKGEEKDLRANFNHLQEAEGWCNRRLNEGAPDWHGEVLCAKLPKTIEVDGVKTVVSLVIKINRKDAIYALRKVNKSPYMHQNKPSAPRKGGEMKVRAKHHQGSRG